MRGAALVLLAACAPMQRAEIEDHAHYLVATLGPSGEPASLGYAAREELPATIARSDGAPRRVLAYDALPAVRIAEDRSIAVLPLGASDALALPTPDAAIDVELGAVRDAGPLDAWRMSFRVASDAIVCPTLDWDPIEDLPSTADIPGAIVADGDVFLALRSIPGVLGDDVPPYVVRVDPDTRTSSVVGTLPLVRGLKGLFAPVLYLDDGAPWAIWTRPAITSSVAEYELRRMSTRAHPGAGERVETIVSEEVGDVEIYAAAARRVEGRLRLVARAYPRVGLSRPVDMLIWLDPADRVWRPLTARRVEESACDPRNLARNVLEIEPDGRVLAVVDGGTLHRFEVPSAGLAELGAPLFPRSALCLSSRVVMPSGQEVMVFEEPPTDLHNGRAWAWRGADGAWEIESNREMRAIGLGAVPGGFITSSAAFLPWLLLDDPSAPDRRPRDCGTSNVGVGPRVVVGIDERRWLVAGSAVGGGPVHAVIMERR